MQTFESRGNNTFRIGPQDLQSLARGSAILRIVSDERGVQIEMSTGLGFTFHVTPSREFEILMSPVAQPEGMEFQSIALLGPDEEPLSGLIERRLWNVRQLHAIFSLLETNRAAEAAKFLKSNPKGDLEGLLPLDDRLRIFGAAKGTWYVDLGKKALSIAKKAPNAALVAISSIFSDGRTYLLNYVKALVQLKEGAVKMLQKDIDIKQLEVEKLRSEADKQKVKTISEQWKTIQAIKDPEVREPLRNAFIGHLKESLGTTATDIFGHL